MIITKKKGNNSSSTSTVNSNTDNNTSNTNNTHNYNTETVKLLLANKHINVNIRDQEHKTPLHTAVAHANNSESIQLLLNYTSAHTSSKKKEKEKEKNKHKGVNVNATDREKWTPLHVAAAHNQRAYVAALIAHAAIDVNARDREGYTPLHVAAARGHTDIVSLLLQHTSVYAERAAADSYTPLFLAAKGGKTAVVEMLLGMLRLYASIYPTDGFRISHFVAASGIFSPENGSSVQNGRSSVCMYSSHSTYFAENGNCYDAALADADGCTVLLYACMHGHIAFVQTVLESKHNTLAFTIPDHYHRTGNSAYRSAENMDEYANDDNNDNTYNNGNIILNNNSSSSRNVPIADNTISFTLTNVQHADVSVCNRAGLTALDLALLHGHNELAAYLLTHTRGSLAHRTNPNKPVRRPRSTFDGEFDDDDDACSSSTDSGFGTLHLLVATGTVAMLRLLLQHRAALDALHGRGFFAEYANSTSVERRGSAYDGFNALHLAVALGRLDMLRVLLLESSTHTAVSAEDEQSGENREGNNTQLHTLDTQAESTSVLALDVNRRTKDGQTPLQLAYALSEATEKEEIIALLLQCGAHK